MHRRLFGALWPLAALALLAAAGCGGGSGGGARLETPRASEGGLRVVATTAQIAALTREVGGDRAQVRSVIRPGVDPHQYEATASDAAALADADLIVRHGMGLDDFLDDAIGASDAQVVTVTRGIAGEEGSLGEGQVDPHVWLDPVLVKMMVANIRDALATVDPPGRQTYESNAEAYNRRLDEVDGQVRYILAGIPPANRKMVTNHDGFGYFARRYGLEVVGAIIPAVSTQAEPSAQETAALLDIIHEQGVKAIFVESSVSPALAHQLARDAGVKVVDDLYVDSLGGPGSGAETVDGMLLADARLIAEALR